jgi:acyl-CoA synthetase (AMP-forming)/AMP-acid ligase II
VLRHWIERAAARDPDKAVIVSADDGRMLSYGALRAATRRIATYLRNRGIGANDRVALLSNNSIEHLLAYYGVMAYGATVCTVHVEMNRNQLDNILPALSRAWCCARRGSARRYCFRRVGALPAARTL